MGISAVGHLAMLPRGTAPEDGLEGEGGWAAESSRAQSVVSHFGPTDLAASDIPPVTRGMIEEFLGGTPDEIPDIYRVASPITHVGPGTAPMLMFHGTSDHVVPRTQAYGMIDALTDAAVHGREELIIG